ncbi:MAG: hypothetical protein IPM54_21215 [Polyangiaceae bacterium]|nr:hypothetical protein [Polyangiaceae bacterium]
MLKREAWARSFARKVCSSGNIVALKLMLEDEPTHCWRWIRESMLLSEGSSSTHRQVRIDEISGLRQLYLSDGDGSKEDLSKRLKRDRSEMHQALC